ncbi:hypothetical protein GUITHDRAFT_110559 [Guillardia theta CCMP2712]|uniref:Smr domain-containing protein n=1 Tax=Guillardia theta (strain CCMP2712) TaxID=905079 RepID=L1J4K8_GUITC|nr:hypothetical protein GUITHDRAFT_110559 [Guillardia theta CCMP2712]EKX43436.1 hypothetical protein GUITHDRAFT_110559 [Guillardia theta CCMP2712]|eukprot:XP_005830416.1 hypothetical protein GUITHDRAFT_110559 [Guillardia theta CCMP2712]
MTAFQSPAPYMLASNTPFCCKHSTSSPRAGKLSLSVLATRMGSNANEIMFVPGAPSSAQPQRGQGSRWEKWYGSSQTAGSKSGLQSATAETNALADGAAGTEDALESLRRKTEESLDWKFLKATLVNCSVTSMGRSALQQARPFKEVEEVERAYNAVEEIRMLNDDGTRLPLSQVGDVRELVTRAAKGDVLELDELYLCTKTMGAMREIEDVLHGRNETPTLMDIADDIHLDGSVVLQLKRSFDNVGQLSTKMYPQLQDLRKEIDKIAAAVTSTMDAMLKDTKIASTLQDSFYTIRENRFVLPVSATNKNKINGIVHGVSGTGSTVYIEPQEVIDLNNKLRLAEGELKAEEIRIMGLLSKKVGSLARDVKLATSAVCQLDMAAAREKFAEMLKAVRPEVSSGGEIDIRSGRHPVLVLRGIKPVANDMSMNGEKPAVVISGPNAGGKTIVLKTVGLCALLVQHGCWVPCEEGSKMALFRRVLASIGDQQTVEEDLSSFSSHLKTLNTMLQHADEGTLILLDEIASGTDPTQGAALAQAILEELLGKAPKMVVTTHYSQLKALATVDSRFGVAAMQYVNGAPTYRVLHGVSGESHAFSIAKKMGILEGVIERAESLMGEQAKMTKTLEALEEERTRASVAAQEAVEEREKLRRKLERLEKREEEIRSRAKELEKEGAREFLKQLKSAEQSVAEVIKQLQQNPDFKEVDKAKKLLDGLRTNLTAQEEEGAGEVPEGIKEGDFVMLLDVGSEGEVISPPSSKGELQVRVGPLTLRTKVDRVRKVEGKTASSSPSPRASGSLTQKRGKKTGSKEYKAALQRAVRTPVNTLDLRGFRAEQVGDAIDSFLDKMTSANQPTAFILSGHGTGVVKKVVQEHLATCMYAAAYAPASFEQGGDALTVVALK